MRVKILVPTHKRYDIPKMSGYYPIQVGARLHEEDFGFLRDDCGNNISEKNPSFSELTALYWAWKNDFFKNADYGGLVHYRRYFKKTSFRRSGVLSEKEILGTLAHFDILVPKKRNYWIETVEQHYRHAHYAKDFIIMRHTLYEMYPAYKEAFATVMKGTKLHLYNMFIMPTPLLFKYMEWIFPLLFEIEKRLDIENYDPYQRRVFGFMAERLFNVWVLHHQRNEGKKVREWPVVQIEGENIFSKGFHMLKRKMKGESDPVS